MPIRYGFLFVLMHTHMRKMADEINPIVAHKNTWKRTISIFFFLLGVSRFTNFFSSSSSNIFDFSISSESYKICFHYFHSLAIKFYCIHVWFSAMITILYIYIYIYMYQPHHRSLFSQFLSLSAQCFTKNSSLFPVDGDKVMSNVENWNTFIQWQTKISKRFTKKQFTFGD